MVEKFVELLLSLTRINTNLKSISKELDKLNTDFINEDFIKLFGEDKVSDLKPEDYE